MKRVYAVIAVALAITVVLVCWPHQKKLAWDLSSSRQTAEIGWTSDGKLDLTSVSGPCSIAIKLEGGCEVKANVQKVFVAADKNEIEYIMLDFGHISSKRAKALHSTIWSDVTPGDHVFKTPVDSKSSEGVPLKTVKRDKQLDLWWEAKPEDDDDWLCSFTIYFLKERATDK